VQLHNLHEEDWHLDYAEVESGEDRQFSSDPVDTDLKS
jgi:hypothetical protein